MSTQRKQGKGWKTIGILVAAVIFFGVVAAANSTRIAALVRGTSSTEATKTTAATTAIQPATVAQTAVSASGKLRLADERSVALGVAGVVQALNVKVGDTVQAGQVLLKLDTTDLERALAQAKLTVASAKVALAKLQAPGHRSADRQRAGGAQGGAGEPGVGAGGAECGSRSRSAQQPGECAGGVQRSEGRADRRQEDAAQRQLEAGGGGVAEGAA